MVGSDLSCGVEGGNEDVRESRKDCAMHSVSNLVGCPFV